jgi:hypothetical protein
MLRLLSLIERRLPEPARAGVTSPMRLGTEVVARSRDARVLALAGQARDDEARYLPTSNGNALGGPA